MRRFMIRQKYILPTFNSKRGRILKGQRFEFFFGVHHFETSETEVLKAFC